MALSVRFGPQCQVLKLALNARRVYFVEYKGKTTSCWTYHINLLFIIDVVQIIKSKKKKKKKGLWSVPYMHNFDL